MMGGTSFSKKMLWFVSSVGGLAGLARAARPTLLDAGEIKVGKRGAASSSLAEVADTPSDSVSIISESRSQPIISEPESVSAATDEIKSVSVPLNSEILSQSVGPSRPFEKKTVGTMVTPAASALEAALAAVDKPLEDARAGAEKTLASAQDWAQAPSKMQPVLQEMEEVTGAASNYLAEEHEHVRKRVSEPAQAALAGYGASVQVPGVVAALQFELQRKNSENNDQKSEIEQLKKQLSKQQTNNDGDDQGGEDDGSDDDSSSQ